MFANKTASILELVVLLVGLLVVLLAVLLVALLEVLLVVLLVAMLVVLLVVLLAVLLVALLVFCTAASLLVADQSLTSSCLLVVLLVTANYSANKRQINCEYRLASSLQVVHIAKSFRLLILVNLHFWFIKNLNF